MNAQWPEASAGAAGNVMPIVRSHRRVDVRIKLATSREEVEAIRMLRRAVFCAEQGIFEHDDTDAIDATALPIAAVIDAADGSREVVGTVRIHQPETGLWYGSRLAVARHARRLGSVGSGLIKLAVSTAHAHGCHTFLAHVQAQNVPLFERLHWHSLEQMDIHGRLHHLMQADLAHYPPIHDGDVGFVLPGRREAEAA
ncbi:MSMEG_0567/Sll0786 family nitrogen starvation N-acetyltransferase [Oxalicibacterium faecigallinarum]|uniref:MSMEG_0567/Sll0786 family nitrogen starvation N-acetyltransferase n=1 Tax=Oxalicibacterium faecigallinarum TaxID=573741 RepID=UPI003593788F